MTRSSTQMTLGLTTCFLGVLVLMLLKTLTRFLDEDRETNRTLLGLSPLQTEQTSLSRANVRFDEPDSDPLDALEGLSPDQQEVLLREYQEHLSQNPRPIRIHPDVEQIVPGQTTLSG